MAKLVEDDTHLFTECGLGREAVLETVLKKIREPRDASRKIDPLPEKKCCQQTVHLSQPNQLSPVLEVLVHPHIKSQLQRVKAYNLYFDEGEEITEVLAANK